MPIVDHFRPPLSAQRTWHVFRHAWAASIARHLNRQVLPAGYVAAPNVQFGARIEIDVGAFDTEWASTPPSDALATLATVVPLPTASIAAHFSDTVEVVIFQQEGGPQLVAALELVSPSNKDRPASRRTFAAKMATYLSQGVALAVLDLVTSRTANLHNEWLTLLGEIAGWLAEDPASPLYANAYRPVQRQGEAAIDLWLFPLHIGALLPTLPIFLRADLSVLLDLETTYRDTCADQRITLPSPG